MIDHLHALAVHAFYCGEHDLGRRACERLLRHELPEHLEPLVRRNRTWYTQPLSELCTTRFVQVDIEPALPGWSLFNPSVVARGDRLLVNVRSSNYRIVGGRYVMPDEDRGVIRTQNLLVEYSAGLELTASPVVVDADYERSDFAVDGLEDVRLNAVDGQVLASATIRNFHGLDGTCRIGVCEILTGSGSTLGLRCPVTPSDQHEKNWMPILGRRGWIYSCSNSGFTCTAEEAAGQWLITVGAKAPAVAREFRGGSQLVPIGDGQWVALVHEVAHDEARIYEHRLVRFNEPAGWKIDAVSPAFAFREPRAIEFAAGLARCGDDLVASFGVRDAEAWLCKIPLSEAVALLEPLS